MSQNKVSAGLVRGRTQRRTGTRRVALCGARTFLGKRLLEILAEDASIARLVTIDGQQHTPTTPSNATVALGRVRTYAVDRAEPQSSARIAEILAAEEIDTFVHLGFLEAPSRNRAYAHDLESVGTLHILNACRERPVQKFVLGSSTLLYGPRYDNPNFLTETHALRGLSGTAFLSDKIDAERQVEAFAREQRTPGVTVLRFAPMLGPSVESFVTRWLGAARVPTLMGYDPLLQFVHEVDALAALKVAIDTDVSGVFNIVGDGVLPLSTVVKLLGRSALPVPHFLARRLCAALWLLGLSEVPAPMLRFLRHLCIADNERQKREFGEAPSYTTREAVLAFGAALRLREARLLTEAFG